MDIDDQSNIDGDDSVNNSINLNSSFSNRYNNNRVNRFETIFWIILFFY